MRRSIVFLLLLVFCSYLSVPVIAASSHAGNNLPACCRRNGKHHCMLRMTKMHHASGQYVSAPPEKCPFCPDATLQVPIQWHPFTLPSAGTFYAALRSHPACAAQTDALSPISFDRSRQKRGPPTFQLS